ncbi:ROK family protein [Actinacidiphila sp. ITFR-21]|uniref:ROK family protein n=1 Tax=Actinacidiphila sp. ITFR-21 TaxID=3075199 RepID=UPI00288A7A9F|nr:ROK family protein [Streptomyces sp. ITFR-21]WNI18037.1 ROK family protein [Streptomyces sp. ITFR-21]
MSAHSSRDVRRASRFEVLHQIYALGSASRNQLAGASGLSAATVAAIVSELLNWGVLSEVSIEDSGGGRPRARLAVNPQRGFVVGVDVAETYIQIDVFDLALQVKASGQQTLDAEDNQPGAVLDRIEHGVAAMLTEAGVPQDSVVGVGVSMPGQVDRVGGVSVFAPNFSWQQVPFIKLLSDRLPLPLYLDNPLKASTMAELWFGVGRKVDDLAVLTIGTGVGAGFAVGGALVRGTGNAAGEWGHSAIVIDGRPCRCGNRGCLEAYIGARGIMQQLREHMPDSRLLRSDDQVATIGALAEGLAADDEAATAVLRRTARYLGVGIGGLINMLNPAVIVVGGWVTELLGPWLVPAATQWAAQHTFDRTFNATRIELSTVVGNPVSLGAGIFALEGFLVSLGVSTFRDSARHAAAIATTTLPAG